jgi:hypothetical protein
MQPSVSFTLIVRSEEARRGVVIIGSLGRLGTLRRIASFAP